MAPSSTSGDHHRLVRRQFLHVITRTCPNNRDRRPGRVWLRPMPCTSRKTAGLCCRFSTTVCQIEVCQIDQIPQSTLAIPVRRLRRGGAEQRERVTTLPQTTATPRLSQPSVDQPFEVELVGLLPHVRAFSIQLCGRTLGEDIAQETLTKAWKARSSYQPGTKMKAWLFTILRNEYISYQRRAWRQVGWDQDAMEKIPAPLQQKWESELFDVRRALLFLPADQREALLLITASGFSYEQAASITATPIGTLKSRVSRARAKLLNLLDGAKSDGARRRTSGRAVASVNL